MISFLPVEWHDTLPSTNTNLVERLRSGSDVLHGTVVAARAQTAGRGRQQREWKAVPQENLTFSFVWNGPLESAYVPSMAQAISVGIARFLEGEGIGATIKWPNDLLVDGKKMGGILCEWVATENSGHVGIVAGVGLNVNMSAEHAAAIDQPATSLFIESGARQSVEHVLEKLLSFLQVPLNAWAAGGFPGIRTDYQSYGWAPGTRVTVRDGAGRVEGTFLRYDPMGALVLECADHERTFYSGDAIPASAAE